jgi:ATP-dependent DNA ligase
MQGVFLGSRPGRVQDRRVRRATAAIYAFALLELDGQDLRREPLETRKATLASLLRGSLPGLRLNEHLAHDGELIFRASSEVSSSPIHGTLRSSD